MLWWFIFPSLIAYFFISHPDAHQLLGSFDDLLNTPLEKQLNQIYPKDFYPGGQDLELPFGKMRYYLFGNGKKRIVFVHGIGPPCPTFHHLAKKLSKQYQVLLYDLYGRGYSQSPGTLHDEGLYLSQLSMLIAHVKFDHEPFILLGYSLGGAIATAYASYFAHQIESLVLVSPAGLLEELPLTARLFSLPLIGEVLIQTKLAGYLMRQSAKSNFQIQPSEAVYEQLKQGSNQTTAEMEVARFLRLIHFQTDHHPGLQRSFLSTTRYFPLTYSSRLLERFKSIGSHLFKGTNDTLIPFSLWHKLKEIIPRAELAEIDYGSHNIITENTTSVYEAILKFL